MVISLAAYTEDLGEAIPSPAEPGWYSAHSTAGHSNLRCPGSELASIQCTNSGPQREGLSHSAGCRGVKAATPQMCAALTQACRECSLRPSGGSLVLGLSVCILGSLRKGQSLFVLRRGLK